MGGQNIADGIRNVAKGNSARFPALLLARGSSKTCKPFVINQNSIMGEKGDFSPTGIRSISARASENSPAKSKNAREKRDAPCSPFRFMYFQ